MTRLNLIGIQNKITISLLSEMMPEKRDQLDQLQALGAEAETFNKEVKKVMAREQTAIEHLQAQLAEVKSMIDAAPDEGE